MEPLSDCSDGEQPDQHEVYEKINTLCSEEDVEYQCFVCEKRFKSVAPHQQLHSHLAQLHNADITYIAEIPLLNEYFDFFKNKVAEIRHKSIEESNNNELDAFKFSKFPPDIEEEQKLREKLKLKFLNQLLQEQQVEIAQEDKFDCLICPEIIQGTIKDICSHMFEKHNFTLGLTDNMVHVSRLLQILRIKLSHLQCIYCERIFKTSRVLKEHMRKKKHWKINQKNPLYDRFYLISYVSSNSSIKSHDEKEEEEFDEEGDSEWQDWNEIDNETTFCLFCPQSSNSTSECFEHMKETHRFDFFENKNAMGLDSYQSICLMNYMRVCTMEKKCFICSKIEKSSEDLETHYLEHKQMLISDKSLFDDSSYMVPVIKGDFLLTGIEEDMVLDDL